MPIAGLSYFLTGFALLGYSVGLERDDLNRLIDRSRRLSRRRGALVPEWLGQYFARAAVAFEPVAATREPQRARYATELGEVGDLRSDVGTVRTALAAGASGHVGFVTAWDGTHVTLLGGNQGDAVCEHNFKIDVVRGWRMM